MHNVKNTNSKLVVENNMEMNQWGEKYTQHRKNNLCRLISGGAGGMCGWQASKLTVSGVSKKLSNWIWREPDLQSLTLYMVLLWSEKPHGEKSAQQQIAEWNWENYVSLTS